MFSDLFNYFVIPTFISIGAFGVYYLLNPENGSTILKNVAWESVKLYSKASIYFENLAQTAEIAGDSDFENDDFDEIKPLLSYYNYEKDLEVQMGYDYNNLPQEWWEDSETNIDLIILKKDTQDSKTMFKTFKNYKKLNSSDKQNWETVEKQFVQVELVQDGVCIDIHKHLDCFYIKGNTLFTPAFLNWYLKTILILGCTEDTYTLKIFDKDVNLFTLTPQQYIILTSDGYKIKNIDEESESEESESEESDNEEADDDKANTSEYEGAQDD